MAVALRHVLNYMVSPTLQSLFLCTTKVVSAKETPKILVPAKFLPQVSRR